MEKYGIDRSWGDEQRRLALIGQCYDPSTTARLEKLGVGAGWRCLEIGAGGGSITRWLRDRTAPDGSVVAIDLDIRFVADEPGIEAREIDFLEAEVEQEAYDLVFCRAVLHHLPGRQIEALRKMTSALRRGGHLLAEDPWLGPVWGSRRPACAAAWRALDAAMPADYGWAVELAQCLLDVGLTEIGAAGEAEFVRGGTPEAELLRMTLEAVRPRMPSSVHVDVEAASQVYRDPTAFEPGVTWYSAWGRRS